MQNDGVILNTARDHSKDQKGMQSNKVHADNKLAPNLTLTLLRFLCGPLRCLVVLRMMTCSKWDAKHEGGFE